MLKAIVVALTLLAIPNTVTIVPDKTEVPMFRMYPTWDSEDALFTVDLPASRVYNLTLNCGEYLRTIQVKFQGPGIRVIRLKNVKDLLNVCALEKWSIE